MSRTARSVVLVSRAARSVVLVAALLTSTLGSPSPAVAASTGLTTYVDHGSRTITFKVRLHLYPACAEPRCRITDGIVTDIENQIRQTWGKDLKYSCYKIKIDLTVTKGTGGPGDVPDGAVGVRIDRTVTAENSFVRVSNDGTPWNGDTANDRLLPVNDPDNPTTWGATPFDATRESYAHEFGHILGLDEGYTKDANGKPIDRAGAAHDIMSTGSGVDQTTVDRLAKRAGIKDSDLRCSFRLTYDKGGVHVRGVKCGGPVGTWILKERIDAAVGQVFDLKVVLGKDLTGTWSFSGKVTAPHAAGSGQSSGTATFFDTNPPALELSGFGKRTIEAVTGCPAS